MCAAIGVDPLVGAKRDGWGVLGVGDFWMGVATRVVGICRNTRGENGGIIGVKEVQRLLEREDRRQRSQTVISEYVPHIRSTVFFWVVADFRDDIVRSISALGPLGPGISIISLRNGERYIRSVPKELNPDQATVLEVAGINGYISVSLLRVNLGWEEERSGSVLEELIVEGMVWVDEGGMEKEYWIPKGITES
jgi:ESCRT-II complex subunit VPS22